MNKIFIITLCVILLVAPLISAGDWSGLDNYKVFIEEGKYGTIEIWDTATPILFQFDDTKLVEYTLTRNTEYCIGWGCEAEGVVTLYQEGKLFNDLKFKDIKNNDRDISFHVYIWVEESYEEEFIDYRRVCEIVEVLKNGTEIEECIGVEDGSHFITRDISHWELYGGENLNAGPYRWKINGRLPKNNKIDWIAESFGIKLDTWAWWDSDFDYCYNLNMEGGDIILDNFPTYVRLNSTVNSHIDTATWGNFRFVNESCEDDGSSIPYEIDNNDTTDAGFWITNIELQIGTNTWSIYVDSSDTVTLNEEPEKVWSNNYTGRWGLEGNYLDSLGIRNGTDLGTSAPTLQTSGCSFGMCYDFDGTDDDVEFPYNAIQVSGTSFIEIWGYKDATSDQAPFMYPAADGAWGPPNFDTGMYFVNDVIIWNGNVGNVEVGYTQNFARVSQTAESEMNYMGVGYDGNLAYAYNVTFAINSDVANGTITSHNTKLVMGSRTAQGGYWDGFIDEARTSKRVRTSAEVNRTRISTDLTLFSFGAEEEPPSLSLSAIQSYPVNVFNTTDNTVGIGCNFTAIDQNIADVSLNIYDSGDNLDYTDTESGLSVTSYNKTWITSALTDDSYNWSCTGLGSLGVNDTTTNRTFMVDTTAPIIDIVYPENTTYNTNQSILNYTYTDISIGVCWYSINSGVTNSSTSVAGTNFTNVFSSQGSNNWAVYCNDSVGYESNDSIVFFMDSLFPLIDYGDGTRANNYNQTLDWIYVNVTVTETDLVNITFLLWNSTAESNRITYDSTRFINWTSLSDDVYTYNVSACDSFNLCNTTATRRLTIDTIAPTVTVEHPTTNQNFSSTAMPLSIQLNWTYSDINYVQACWYWDGTVNTTVTCGDNATINLYNGQRTLVGYANDSAGNWNSDSVTFNIYNYSVSQAVDKTSIGEGDTTTFNLTIHVDDIDYWSGSFAKLLYNGTYYDAVVSTRTNEKTWTRSIIIPDTLGGSPNLVNWSWNYSIELETTVLIANTTQNQTQLVYHLTLDDCSVQGTLVLNYSLKNEETQSVISLSSDLNSTIDIDVNIYTIDTSALIINYSHRYTNNTNPQVCIVDETLNSTPYKMDVVTKYEATGYATEYSHIQSFTLTNNTIPQNINLFDLASADSTEFLITFKDETFALVGGALIDITRYYVDEGLFKTIEIPKTDSNGQAMGHFVQNDVIYTLIISKEGTILAIFNDMVAVCADTTIGDCKINLNAFLTGIPATDFETEYNLNIATTFDEDARRITTIFSTIDGSVSTVQLNATQFTGYGNTTVCSHLLTSSSGTLICDIPESFGNVTVIAKLYSSSSPDRLVKVWIFTIEEDAMDIFGYTGIVLVFILILTIPFLLISSTIGMIIGTFIGLIIAALLNIYEGGGIIGVGATVLWAIIAGGIIIWKISQRGEA